MVGGNPWEGHWGHPPKPPGLPNLLGSFLVTKATLAKDRGKGQGAEVI